MLSIFTNNKAAKLTNILLMTSGLAVGTSFFYWYMYRPFSKPPLLLDNTFKKREEEPYENKYYSKYDQLESEDLSEEYVKGLKNSIVYEFTPKGSVLMYYDFDKGSFIYYCHTKDMPYLFLETVARKYVITNKCKSIFVDIKRELELAKETLQDNQTKNVVQIDHGKTTQHTTNANDIYASFKSYNRKGSGGSNTTNKRFILRQNANRYSHVGKISDFKIIKSHEYKICDQKETMDYDAYKKMMATGTQNNDAMK